MLLNKFIKNMARLDFTVVQLGITALLLLPYVFITKGFSILGVSRSSIPCIILLGIVNTGFGFWLFFSGMQKLKGQSIAVLSYEDPFAAILISGLILQEQMTIIQMLGGALPLGSTFFSEAKFSRLSIQSTKTLSK
jgi:drug/metabolite transporter (DMT)-like permease